VPLDRRVDDGRELFELCGVFDKFSFAHFVKTVLNTLTTIYIRILSKKFVKTNCKGYFSIDFVLV
jgi:hypothetical protein